MRSGSIAGNVIATIPASTPYYGSNKKLNGEYSDSQQEYFDINNMTFTDMFLMDDRGRKLREYKGSENSSLNLKLRLEV